MFENCLEYGFSYVYSFHVSINDTHTVSPAFVSLLATHNSGHPIAPPYQKITGLEVLSKNAATKLVWLWPAPCKASGNYLRVFLSRLNPVSNLIY